MPRPWGNRRTAKEHHLHPLCNNRRRGLSCIRQLMPRDLQVLHRPPHPCSSGFYDINEHHHMRTDARRTCSLGTSGTRSLDLNLVGGTGNSVNMLSLFPIDAVSGASLMDSTILLPTEAASFSSMSRYRGWTRIEAREPVPPCPASLFADGPDERPSIVSFSSHLLGGSTRLVVVHQGRTIERQSQKC